MKQTILLLGGLGFIGRNLLEELKQDYHVVVFGRRPHQADESYTYYSGDFTQTADLSTVFQHHQIDLVIHAVSTTIPATANISNDVSSNIVSTIQLLDLMRQYSVPKIIFLSSGGTVYGRITGVKTVNEDYPTNPISSYGITKLTIEKYLYLYQQLYQLDYLILRLSNPFGEYHSSAQQGLINITLKKALHQEPIVVWGDGEIIRDYIYIKDLSYIIHQLITKNITNQVINIGSGQGQSINQILDLIQQQVGQLTIQRQAPRQFDVPNIVLDTHKLQTLIDYQLTPLAEGIKHTYTWIKQSYA